MLRRIHVANIHVHFKKHVVKLYEIGLKLFSDSRFN